MKVEVIQATADPVGVIALAAGTSHGKADRSPARVARCIEDGHTSVLEHVCATFRITGISRACSHQLVRHRMASYVQLSQRYTTVDVLGEDWYVTPPEVLRSSDRLKGFREAMRSSALRYKLAISEGLPAEDARYMLPEATCTEVTMTVNLREFMHFVELRDDVHAQWEIRELARLMKAKLAETGGWDVLVGMIAEG